MLIVCYGFNIVVYVLFCLVIVRSMISEAHSTYNQTKLSGYYIVGVYMLTDFFFKRLALIWSVSKYFVDSPNPRECLFWDCSFFVGSRSASELEVSFWVLGMKNVPKFFCMCNSFLKFLFAENCFHSFFITTVQIILGNFIQDIFFAFLLLLGLRSNMFKYFLLISFPLAIIFFHLKWSS